MKNASLDTQEQDYGEQDYRGQDYSEAAQSTWQILASRKKQRKPLSQFHPILYSLCVWLRQKQRLVSWLFDGRHYACTQQTVALPFRVIKHQSVLLRKLGDADMELQRNKVTNLLLALPFIDGLIIKPGEVFSFCRRVRRPTAKRGFLHGMELSFGKARPGIGGGLCQITNLIHWLALHSPLTVSERHHHSFDPFPDSGRVLPFGSGAAVFYNYLDYQLTNDTPFTFQIRLWICDKCLNGELRCDKPLPVKYHVFQEKHLFLRYQGDNYRTNEIWRSTVEKGHAGREIKRELLAHNIARMGYEPPWFVPEDGLIVSSEKGLKRLNVHMLFISKENPK